MTHSRRAQSTIEFATLLPVMLVMTLGSLAVGLWVISNIEVNAATSLAAASAASEPACGPPANCSATDAKAAMTYSDTIGQYPWFDQTQTSLSGCAGYTRASPAISCQGHAKLKLFNFPDWALPQTIVATYTATGSDYRVCQGNTTTC